MSARATRFRYAAMLLFQFRVVTAGRSDRRRTCERRLIVFEATGARDALRHAKQRGRAGKYSYRNAAGGTVHFEFVGVQDLLRLGPECGPDEVWYDVVELMTPMERRARLIPPEAELCAMAEGRPVRGGSAKQMSGSRGRTAR